MKILIFFCDGLPNAQGYGGKVAREDLQNVQKRLKQKPDYTACSSDWNGSGRYPKNLWKCLYQCRGSGKASAADCKETFRLYGIKTAEGTFSGSFF